MGYLDLQASLTDVDPLAVCNDGTPASFYFRKAPADSASASLWLVYLEGGMWCYSQQTCDARYALTPWEMSSNKQAPQLALGGIFSTSAKNPWAQANVAYLPYCSSDAWVGDVAASNATFGYAFRGQRILQATLQALVRDLGLGSQRTGEKLLLSGCSAGARGAMLNLDYVSPMLADLGISAQQVAVSGLLDSPLWVEVPPATPHITPLSNETRAVFSFVNATARLGPGCEALYPYEEQWKCLFGQFRMPLLQTPYLLNAAQDDKFELPYNIGGTTPAGYDVQSWHPDQVAYAQAFGPQVSAVVASLPALPQQKRSAVFSTACFRHCVTDSAAFWNVAVAPPAGGAGGTTRLLGRRSVPAPLSLRDVASEWYFGKPPQPYRVVQSCVGFRCGDCTTRLAKKLAAGHKRGHASTVSYPADASTSFAAHAATTIVVAMLLTALAVGCMLRSAAATAVQSARVLPASEYARPLMTGLRSSGASAMARPGEKRYMTSERMRF